MGDQDNGGKKTVSFEEIAYSNIYEIQAIINVLEAKGVLTKEEILEEIKALRKAKESDAAGAPSANELSPLLAATGTGASSQPTEWQKVQPDVSIEWVDGWDGGYSIDPQASYDVYVSDAIFLDYFKSQNWLIGLQKSQVSEFDDLLDYAATGIVENNLVYDAYVGFTESLSELEPTQLNNIAMKPMPWSDNAAGNKTPLFYSDLVGIHPATQS